MSYKTARIIAIANEKGGVGKTVTAINLAAACSLKGMAALVVDVDPQSNATRGLSMAVDETALTTYSLISNPETVSAEDVILHTPWKGLDLIPSHVDLVGAEIELVDEVGRENRLKDAMKQIQEDYDVIILDTPPSLSLLTVNVFASAEEVIVPCQTHPYAYDALEELFDTISSVQIEINPGLKVAGILATMFDQRTRVSHNTLNKLQSDNRYKDFMYRTVIRSNTTIADSAEAGKPVVFYRTTSYGAQDYRDFADEVLEKI